MIHVVKREKHVVDSHRPDRANLKEGDILVISKYRGRVKEKYIVTSDTASCSRCALLSTTFKCEHYPILCHGRALLKLDDIMEDL